MKILIFSTLLAFGAVAGNAAEGAAPFALAVVPSRSSGEAMSVEIGGENAQPFYTVLTNRSKETQPVFETWNSWGYDNVEFEATMPDGKVLQIKRGLARWSRNFPSTFLILPGEQFVISFPNTSPTWEIKPAWPKNGEYNVTLKAIYKVTESEDSKDKKVWAGRIESEQAKVKITFRAPTPKKVEPTGASKPEPKKSKKRA